MFAKFSIRAKIICLVSLLLLALAGMGLLSATSMRSLNAHTKEIANSWLPSIKALGELNVGAVYYRNVLNAHMLAETLEDKAVLEKTMAGIVENMTNVRKSYETMITSPEERALYTEWSARWQEYAGIAAKVLDLSRKEAGRLPREALQANQQAIKVGNEAKAILAKDIELNDRGAAQDTKAAEDTYSSILMMLAAIVGLSILAGAAVSFYVIRDVAAGIASIVEPMQALG
ncbi:MAG TPA: MCP four helix bundle domain-containing protein [Bradyrhizobium sp.]|uniref:MCP four helix bundle domain-containing protein n=1 Tax=Bradyrhizobium sp. TaxID=376 RepID=UPI002D7E7A2D|nr:MCP four helix bundle domain-containing protein [Bradyrhizobium sp.]HET7886478.1 MCP four helix bundle domain-containing protein [Bradyrhizobium sp.]